MLPDDRHRRCAELARTCNECVLFRYTAMGIVRSMVMFDRDADPDLDPDLDPDAYLSRDPNPGPGAMLSHSTAIWWYGLLKYPPPHG
jgi:hypothetical protein